MNPSADVNYWLYKCAFFSKVTWYGQSDSSIGVYYIDIRNEQSD